MQAVSVAIRVLRIGQSEKRVDESAVIITLTRGNL